MWHDFFGDDNFFEQLRREDLKTAAAVQVAGCRYCDGRLDRADFPRKPRGARVAVAGEGIDRRISLCCARSGCRRRSTPASLVFLGRRVYLALAVLVESLRAMTERATEGAPARRTLRRWLGWFRRTLPSTRFFRAQQGRFVPPVESRGMPASLVERFSRPGRPPATIASMVLAFLSPLGASPGLLDAAISRER